MDLKPHILVTGGCGYIGSHVTRQMSEAGYPVVVLDDLSSGHRGALLGNETFIEGSVGDGALLDHLFTKYDFAGVLHFAASIFVDESVANPLLYYRNNTANTIVLLEAMVKRGVAKLIFSSTAAVYGETGDEPLTELSETRPQSPYGSSKLMNEWIIADAAAAHGLRHVTLRYFNVGGADLKGRIGQRNRRSNHLIKIALEAAVGKRERLAIYGEDYATLDGTCVRDYIHVEDLAAAHVNALEYLLKGGTSQTLNCGYGRGYSVKEVVQVVEDVTGKPLQVVVAPRRPGDVARLVADARQIRAVLGWQPQYDQLNVIVKSAWDWEKKLRSGL